MDKRLFLFIFMMKKVLNNILYDPDSKVKIKG